MSTRMERADAEIQKVLSEILLKDVNDPRLSSLITIVSVKTTPDFKYSKIKVGVLSSDKKEREETLLLLKKSGTFLRTALVGRMKLPSAPKLMFELNEGSIHSERINEILENLVIPPLSEDEEE